MQRFKKVFIICSILLAGFVDAKEYVLHGKNQDTYKTKSQKKKLFKQVGTQYFNDIEIDYDDFDLLVPEETNYYQTSFQMIDGNTIKYQKAIKKRLLAPMYLKWISPEIGYGIFATKKIKKDDVIGVYAGTLRVMEISGDDVDYAWYYPINTIQDQRMVVDGKFKGNELRFINHSSDPNTRCLDVLVDGVFYMIYVATKDIAKDEELTVSYGSGYWDSRKINPH